MKKRSLNMKILLAMISVVLVTAVSVIIIFGVSMMNLFNTMIDASEQMGEKAEARSADSLTERMIERLGELATDKADLADQMFVEFEDAVRIAADAAQNVYANADSYSLKEVPLPDAANDGKLAVQLLFSANTDPESPKVQEEAGLLGNLQDTLLAINNNYENMVSNYIASETGIMIQADYISGTKFDDAGNILPYEAKERPWYQGASATGEPYFTPISKDAHTSRIGIMCGAPIYYEDRLMGVAGAGMYLDDIEALVQSVDLGENGEAFILNQDGQVLFSTHNEEELAVTVDGMDLRTSDNAELSEIATKAVSGERGNGMLEIGGEKCYVAYAPMETVGWSFCIVLSQEEVEAPASRLLAELEQLTDQTVSVARGHIRKTIGILIAVIIPMIMIVLCISLRVSGRIVRPIRKLTDEVSNLEGDNLDFSWDINTGDEIQLLANSFQSLTQRMKTYISDIQAITAEKERIGAELSIATQIQADMLPCIFPAFPDRNDFDIYASMTPAKEVGGDFYDFFLLDHDHLAMVIADVSGKGVPAALFMVISKTLIKDQTQMCASPKEILEKVNNLLCENNAEGMFVTVWLGIMEISTGRIIAANAGHEYPAVRKADGQFELLKDKHGMVAGAMEGMRYTEYEMEVERGGCLFVYTDGVPEATNGQDVLYGTDRMINALNLEPLAEPERLLHNVRKSVDEFVGDAPQFDDLTMLAVVRR